MFLTDPITSEQATSLCDAIERRATLDHVIEWLTDSALSWREFITRKQDLERQARVLKSASDRIEYEKQRSESEMSWKTKAQSPWQAAMNDTIFQAEYDAVPIEHEFGHLAKPCPRCSTKDLKWFYFIEPLHPYEERMLPRFAGWVTACERCNVTVDYLGTEFVMRARARGLRVMF
jgi:hypothetical protein